MRPAEGALLGLLAVGILEAGALAWRTRATPVVLLPLLAAGDPPGDLFAPGGDQRVLRGKLAQLGDFVTVEDLARGALAEVGSIPAAEQSELTTIARETDRLRRELLRTEDELRAAEEALDAEARAVFATLTVEQRTWVLDHRNEVSVGRVEDAYWAELLGVVEPPP